MAFLLGSIPFGLLIGKSQGIDIRAHGSGNIGATNVFRVIGKKYGLFCFLLDFLKGAIPALIGITLFQYGESTHSMAIKPLLGFAKIFREDQQTLAQFMQIFTGLCAILGHNYCPWLNFKGGKGIATSLGVLLALMPAAILILAIIWAILFFTTKYVSIASIGSSLSLPILTHLGARFHHINNDKTMPTLWEAGTWNKPLFFFTIAVALLATWRHRSNIRKLLNGTEHRFGQKDKK